MSSVLISSIAVERAHLGGATFWSCKPKVSMLIVFWRSSAGAGRPPGFLPALIFGTIGIALASGSAAAFNHMSWLKALTRK